MFYIPNEEGGKFSIDSRMAPNRNKTFLESICRVNGLISKAQLSVVIILKLLY